MRIRAMAGGPARFFGWGRTCRILALAAALAIALSACSGQDTEVSAAAGTKRLNGWMHSLRQHLSDYDLTDPWRVSTRGHSGAGCANGARAYYLADFTLQTADRSRDDFVMYRLIDLLANDSGWTSDFDGPYGPDGKGFPRVWFGERRDDDPTGTQITVTYQWNGSGFHVLMFAHTACLSTG